MGTVLPTNDEIRVDIDLRCIDFPFDKAWFVQRAQYWLADLDFEERARQAHADPSSCVLVGWHNVKLSAACLQVGLILYVGIEPFAWSPYWSHRLLGVPTPPVLVYYNNVVFRPHGDQRHLIRVTVLTAFTVRTVMHFFWPRRTAFFRLIAIIRV